MALKSGAARAVASCDRSAVFILGGLVGTVFGREGGIYEFLMLTQGGEAWRGLLR